MNLPRSSLILDSGWIMLRHGRTFVVIAILAAFPQLAVAYAIYTSAESVLDVQVQFFLRQWSWVPVTILASVATAPAEVHWHRILILGERHRLAHYFRIDTQILRYLAVGMLVLAIINIPGLVADYLWRLWVANGIDMADAVGLFYRLRLTSEAASVALSLLFATFLGPIFSALAVGRERSGFASILKLTRGCQRQLASAYFFGFETWRIAVSIFFLIFVDRFTGYSLWDFGVGAFTNWITFRYVAITADAYMELERRQALESFGTTFD